MSLTIKPFGNLALVDSTQIGIPLQESDEEDTNQNQTPLYIISQNLNPDFVKDRFNQFLQATSPEKIVKAEKDIREICYDDNILVNGHGTLRTFLMRLKMEQRYTGVDRVEYEREESDQITKITKIVLRKR